MRFNGYWVAALGWLLWGCGQKDTGDFVSSGIVEGTAVKVAAQTGGFILKIHFEEGEYVQQDQVIAIIDTEKIAYQLEQLRAGLEEADIQRAINVNMLEKARADFENIQTKYKRFQDLHQKQSASKQTLDDLQTALQAAKAQLQSARQSLRLIESKKKALHAQEKLLRRQISDATITAPLSGIVTTKFYEEGETVPTGFPVVEIIDLSRMWTKVYVSETLLPRVKIGQQARIRIDGSKQILPGRVSWVSPKAEFTPKNIFTEETRTSLVYAVKVTVENPEQILKHGMPVEVELQLN